MSVIKPVAYNALATASTLAVGMATTHLLGFAWRKATGHEVPDNPGDDDIPWREALLWGAVSGAVVGLGKVAARRGATAAWRAALDEDPPGVD